MRLVVNGCCGRMGALICEEAAKDSARFELVGAVEHKGHPMIGKPLASHPRLNVTDDLRIALTHADLAIEFTNPEASVRNAKIVADTKVAMVIGTTGFTPEQFSQLRESAKQIPIFWSPNMSVGIIIVRRTIASIFELFRKFGLNDSVKVQMSEVHHTEKKDAPSGTAKQLAEDVRKASGLPFRDEEITAIREGTVVGIHTLTLESGAERIQLQHEATDRRVFAQGALLVSENFLKKFSRPGWYTMDDLL